MSDTTGMVPDGLRRLMIPTGRDRSFTPRVDRYRDDQRRESPRRLMFSFVRIAQGSVQGRLEPYFDPE